MGIEIRRLKSGKLKSKWWYGSYQSNGKRRVVNLNVEILGKVPRNLRHDGNAEFEQSRGQAQLALERHQREAMTQKSTESQLEQIYEIRTGEKVGSIPLGEMADGWLKTPHARNRSKRYVDQSEATIENFVTFIKEHYPSASTLDRVNPKMAQAWLASFDEDGICPATYTDKLVLLRSVFKTLKHAAGMAWNPFDGILARKRETIHRKPFTAAELTKIIEKADSLVRPVIITGICTAMRRGDCCLLKWADVDLKQGFVSVKTSKTGETAEIPILPLLRESLQLAGVSRGSVPVTDAEEIAGYKHAALKNIDLSEYVWPEAAQMFLTNRYGISHRTAKAIKDAGITDTLAKTSGKRNASVKDFHSLRTTWITLALSAGVPMELVRRVTGHTTTDVVLKNYFRPGREDFRKAIEGAMPKMLTKPSHGDHPAIDVESVEISPDAGPGEILDRVLKALDGVTAKTWKKRCEVVVGLVKQAKARIYPQVVKEIAAPGDQTQSIEKPRQALRTDAMPVIAIEVMPTSMRK
jgi:integrase